MTVADQSPIHNQRNKIRRHDRVNFFYEESAVKLNLLFVSFRSLVTHFERRPRDKAAYSVAESVAVRLKFLQIGRRADTLALHALQIIKQTLGE